MLCINLEGDNIGPLGCIEIKNWIVNSDDSANKYCKLRGINLSLNNITDRGVKHLAKALKKRVPNRVLQSRHPGQNFPSIP